MVVERRTWEEDLEFLARELGLETAHPVPVVREITASESQEVWLDCMAEGGWVADEQGGIRMPPEQSDAYATASYECFAAYPVEERFLQGLSPQAWEVIYDHHVENFAPCVAQYGYQAPDLPTKEVFLADPVGAYVHSEFAEEMRALRQQFAADGLDDEEFTEQTCPIAPHDDLLFPP